MKKLLILLLFSQSLYAADYTQDANCEAAWLFGEGSGTTIDDASPNSNTANFKGTNEPAWNAAVPDARVDYSTLFDASDDYIDCGTGASLSGNTAFTAMCWVKDVHCYDNYFILSQRGPGYEGEWMLWTDDGGGVHFDLYESDYQFQISSTGNIEDEDWHHLAIRRNADGSGQIYIDGSQDGTSTGSNQNLDSSNHIYIGNDGLDGGKCWYGYITEAAIFSRALTPTEIADIYTNGLVGGEEPPAAAGAASQILILDDYQ